MALELDVGGVLYKTTISTLTSVPNSYFGRKFSSNWLDKNDGPIFIDRDGEPFKYVLEYLRNGPNILLPKNRALLKRIHLEAQFFCLSELMEMVQKVLEKQDPNTKLTLVFHVDSENLFYVPHVVFITMGQLSSVAGSYFWDLADNIKNDTMEKDRYGRFEKGEYHIRIGSDYRQMLAASAVCDVLVYGKAVCDFKFVKVEDFVRYAKLFNVPQAVLEGLKVKNKLDDEENNNIE